MSDDLEGEISHVQDAPMCLGCGLMSQPDEIERHAGICSDCFHRQERWCGGGPLRVITRHGDHYHETPLCPAVQQGSMWKFVRDEDMMYADLAGDVDKCRRCHNARWWGFDHYRGDDEAVIGHA